MNDLEQYLKTYFKISDDQLSVVSALFEFSMLSKNDFYLEKDHYCKKMSFLKSGLLRIFAPYDGKEITQWVASKGYFITDLSSFYNKIPARFSIQALTDCKLYTISESNYVKLNDVMPNWSQIEKEFLGHCFITIENRVFNHLAMTAEERYDAFYTTNKEIFNQVPLQYLASMLGMSAETLSRIRKKKVS